MMPSGALRPSWRGHPKRLRVATGAFCLRGDGMLSNLREGDWVRHRSSPDLLRVVGIGSTIAVRFPKGEMKAFEACELEKVTNAELPLRKMRTHGYIEEQRRGSVEQYMLLIVVSLLYLIMLGWWLMAGGGR